MKGPLKKRGLRLVILLDEVKDNKLRSKLNASSYKTTYDLMVTAMRKLKWVNGGKFAKACEINYKLLGLNPKSVRNNAINGYLLAGVFEDCAWDKVK